MAPDSPAKASAVWKGKARATEEDYSDLDPVITYRHLHSRNLGVKDPLRVIALCDSDAFYAACEQVRLGIDPSRPLVVRQWDSLIAVNYPARKYGISRMDKVNDALKRCPHLVVQHVATYREGDAEPGYWDNPDTLTHKVSLDYYRRESWKIYHMFKDGMPTAEIEKASIDEAFIDFTRPVRDEILKRYPYLAEVPADAPLGKDSPLPPPPPVLWEGLGTVIPVNPPPPLPAPSAQTSGEPAVQDGTSKAAEATQQPTATSAIESTEDSSGVEEDDSPTTWHDIALSISAELMAKMRHEIYNELGYTMTADLQGIARNKFLAKVGLTASYKKPNSQSILRNAAIPNYLRPLPFQKIRFLGGKLGAALAEEYDVKTVGDLLTVTLDEMQSRFGEESIWVWEILQGIDRTEVKEKPPVTKSMLASKNLPKPITKAEEGHHWIRVLAAELALRLREARESIPALWPKSIVLHVRQGYETMRSKQVPFPFVREITVDLIAAAGDRLWKELIGAETSRAAGMKITNVQLSFSGIESMETGQKRIEGFFSPPTAKPQSTVDGAEDHWLQGPPSTSTKPPSGVKRKRPSSSLRDDTNSEKPDLAYAGSVDVDVEKRATSAITPSSVLSFVCDRCGKHISLPDSVIHSGDNGSDGGTTSEAAIREEAQARLARLRSEHDDFHFAQDLDQNGHKSDNKSNGNKRRTIRPNESSSATGQQNTGKRRKKPSPRNSTEKDGKEPKGIARFFMQGPK
ncbi:hypothetical protein NM688_g1585 [Phlebia brevispora]|uniref:Uncharacterized protein n=1 Tax=Phlebia brevispora TaxID=194682 RepID=A0ACC1TBA3_9APHY|nr:hypothetical protein NM688_g1585 [Phlebia brevispora]